VVVEDLEVVEEEWEEWAEEETRIKEVVTKTIAAEEVVLTNKTICKNQMVKMEVVVVPITKL